MRYTNNFNLPDAICNAIINDEYNKGGADYSITQLLKPPLMVQLEKRYDDQIVVDVSESIWALMGKSVHYILEKGASNKVVAEERLYANVGDFKISGAIDWFDENLLQDYKVTSSWNIVYGSPDKDWKEQTNYYRWLLHQNGFKDINKLQVVAILRDWKKNEAMRNKEYPQRQVQTIDIEVMDMRQTEHDLRNRVFIHSGSEGVDINKVPPCTPKERWETQTKYAVMRKGRKSAVKLFDDESEANDKLNELKGHYVEKRPGERKRCSLYCRCAPYCPVYKENK